MNTFKHKLPLFCTRSHTMRLYQALTLCIPPVLIFVITWYSPAPSWSLNQPWVEGDVFDAALAQRSEPSMSISAVTQALTLCISLLLHWLNYCLCNFVSDSQTRVVRAQFRITWCVGLQTTQPLGNSLPQAVRSSVLTCVGDITPLRPEIMQFVPEKLLSYKVLVCSNSQILCTLWILLFHHFLTSLFCNNIS